jgi:hypothetical protein
MDIIGTLTDAAPTVVRHLGKAKVQKAIVRAVKPPVRPVEGAVPLTPAQAVARENAKDIVVFAGGEGNHARWMMRTGPDEWLVRPENSLLNTAQLLEAGGMWLPTKWEVRPRRDDMAVVVDLGDGAGMMPYLAQCDKQYKLHRIVHEGMAYAVAPDLKVQPRYVLVDSTLADPGRGWYLVGEGYRTAKSASAQKRAHLSDGAKAALDALVLHTIDEYGSADAPLIRADIADNHGSWMVGLLFGQVVIDYAKPSDAPGNSIVFVPTDDDKRIFDRMRYRQDVSVVTGALERLAKQGKVKNVGKDGKGRVLYMLQTATVANPNDRKGWQ